MLKHVMLVTILSDQIYFGSNQFLNMKDQPSQGQIAITK